MNISISDIKGAYGQRLKKTTSDVLKELVKVFLKNEFCYEKNNVDISNIYTISMLKCLFKNGLTTFTSYFNDNYIYDTVFKISRFDMNNCKWPNVEFNKCFEKTYIGVYKYINYEIHVRIEHVKDDFEGLYCELAYKFNGDLTKSLDYCPYKIKKEFIYKDINDVQIQKLDDIIYIKNNELKQGTVNKIKENLIITYDGARIVVSEYMKNKHIIVSNNRVNFAGIKV